MLQRCNQQEMTSFSRKVSFSSLSWILRRCLITWPSEATLQTASHSRVETEMMCLCLAFKTIKPSALQGLLAVPGAASLGGLAGLGLVVLLISGKATATRADIVACKLAGARFLWNMTPAHCFALIIFASLLAAGRMLVCASCSACSCFAYVHLDVNDIHNLKLGGDGLCA